MSKKFRLPDELSFLTVSGLPQKVSNTRMDGKICVITGNTSGVGYHASIRLVKAGAKIVMIVRNKDKAESICTEIRSFSDQSPAYYIADFAKLSEVRKACYYLASSPEMQGVSGKFFNLTNVEIPVPHAINRTLGKNIFERSIELVQLDKSNFYDKI
jgi:hypothetical protein